MLKQIARQFLPKFIRRNAKAISDQRALKRWQASGRPSPPPHIVKQLAIKEYHAQYGCGILVETGTFLGDMVDVQKGVFTKVISIELGKDLYEKAKLRFKSDSNVELHQGDSGQVLPHIMKSLDQSALFWLDGHYSAGITARGEKDCPIFEELDAILKVKKHDHVLLIDDARCFVGQGDYPTIERLTEYIRNYDPRYSVHVENDIIRYTV